MSKSMLTALEKKVVASLQGSIPVTRRPFKELAESIGISEEKYLMVVEELHESGIIRRFGATLKHQKSGFNANAMVAWKVEDERAREVGEIMASFREVTHCYRRNPAPTWPYSLYTMVHAADQEGCRAIAARIAEAVSVDEYELLFSEKELKKTSMQYFTEEDNDEDLATESA